MSEKIIVKNNFFPLEKYRHNKFNESNCISFTGSPSKHPYEDDKFILIRDPLSNHRDFLEFHKDDIVFVEELPAIYSDSEQEPVNICRIWIKSGVVALKIQPFIVGDTAKAKLF